MQSGNRQSQACRRITRAILAGSVLAITATLSYASITVHQARAYGAEVNVGSAVKLGPAVVAQLPSCNTQVVGSFTATAVSENEPGLATTGVVNSTASSVATSSTGTSDILGVDLVAGLITASEIKAVSTSSVSSGGVYQSSSSGSIFSDLKVAGLPIAANVAPNTVIELPFVGSVTLNEQSSSQSGDMASFSVNMIHVRITLGLNKGTEIIIGYASSMIKGQSGPAVVGGYAYAPELVAGPVTSGPLAMEIIPCYGTYGAVDTDAVAGTNFPGVLTTGAVTVTGSGNINKTETTSEATSTIAGVNLLGGLLSATSVQGVATGVTTDGVTFDFAGGSTFVGISVAGHPEITANVAPNTKIAIANLGTLTLNKIIHYPNRIKIVPVDLVINTSNTLGLPIGAELTMGVVEAQLHSAEIP